MLQSIRDRTHGWIAGVIISLVILSFALWGIHSYLESSANTEVVAKVNGLEISKRELAAAFAPLRNQAQVNLGSSVLPEAMEANLKARALNALIDIQVLKQASINQHYVISDLQVSSYLERMPDFQVNGEFSLARLKQILANNMISIGDFLELIKTTLLIDQPRLGVILTSYALPDETSDTIALVNQERDISYAIVSREAYLQDFTTISPDEMQAYYQAHESEFKTPEQVTISYIQLSTKDLAAAQHPTDDVLKNYYNDNINSYTAPMQWNLTGILIPVDATTTADKIDAAMKQIADIQEQLNKGADFDKFAHQYPDTEVSATNAVTLSQLPLELQKSVASLTKVGAVSDIIKTSKGLVLVKVVGFKDAVVQPFEQVKGKVQEAYVRQVAEEKYADLREKLANITYEHPDSLEPAARALGLSIETSQPFTRDKGGSGISSNRKIRDAAFTDDVLNSQNNSDAIQLGADTTVVLRINSHTPAALLSLQSVAKQVSDQLRLQKAEDKARQVAEEITHKLQNGATPEMMAQQYHLTWNKEANIGRYSNKVDSAILFKAFRLPRPQGAHALYAAVKTPSGFAIVGCNAVRDGSISAGNQEQLDVFADQVQNSQGMLEYKLYEQSLLDRAKVIIYKET